MSSRRIVITGIGIVSPLGATPQAYWEALREGRSGVDWIAAMPAEEIGTPYAAEAKDFTGHINDFGELAPEMAKAIRKNLKVMCREIQMGVAAANRALNHASLAGGGEYSKDRVGVLFASDHIITTPHEFIDSLRNCIDEKGELRLERWAEKGLPQLNPLWLLKFLPNMPASHTAIYNAFYGPNNTVTMREAGPNLALAEARSTLERGHADMIVCGATGTRVHTLRSLHLSLQETLAPAGVEPRQASRPFDRDRRGIVVGEGAAAVTLEELAAAQQRGATIYGEIVGSGSSAVMAKNGKPDLQQALALAMKAALRSAGLAPDDIGHVNAHGLSTIPSDAAEARAIHEIFGGRNRPVPVVAPKSYFGNLGAAGGLCELVGSLMALEAGHLFPVLNFETQDDSLPKLALARNCDVPSGTTALSINVTPQGQASAVVVRKFSAA